MESSKLIGRLSLDSAPVNSRSAGDDFLHRRRGSVELQRLVVLGQRRVQDIQVPADVQLVLEHIHNGADRYRSLCGSQVSHEELEHRTEVQRACARRLDPVAATQLASGRMENGK